MTYNRPSQSSIVHSTTDVLASLLENGDVQRLLRVIKLIKSAGPDVDVIGQVIDRRPLQSVLREQSLPRVEQLVADALAFFVPLLSAPIPTTGSPTINYLPLTGVLPPGDI